MTRRRDTPSERDLLGLADGSLPAARRARVERAVAASPELQAIIAAQRRALSAVHHAASEPAPAALRAQLELARAPVRRQRATRRAGATFPRSGPRALTGAAVSLAAAAIVAALLIGGAATGAPTVADAAVLATRTSLAPAPVHRGGGVTLPRLSAAGLPFPYWDDRFGYQAVGVRSDRLDGRVATTVFYSGSGRRVVYTIVSGAPLPAGSSVHGTTRDGVRLRSLTVHGRLVVTWLRRGHTCVLTSTDAPLPVLLRLAAWQGGGEIPY